MFDIVKENKTIFLFLLKAVGFYIAWLILYNFFLEPIFFLDNKIVINLIVLSEKILNIIGYTTFKSLATIGIEGTSGLIVSASCDGLDLFILFSIFVISFPGKVLYKAIFIPIGIMIIHFLNIIRIVALALIELYSPQSLAFNHSYTFTLAMYLVIFVMWLIWVRYFSKEKSKPTTTQHTDN